MADSNIPFVNREVKSLRLMIKQELRIIFPFVLNYNDRFMTTIGASIDLRKTSNLSFHFSKPNRCSGN